MNPDIHPYQRDKNSVSQELMRELVMYGMTMIDAPDIILFSVFAPFCTVSTDLQGIGYSVYFYDANLEG